MEKKITLSKNQFARLDNPEPFIISENENLVFNFESEYDLSNAVITLKNNRLQKNYKLEKSFIIPKEFLFGGRLNFSITLYVDGEKVKKWIGLSIRLVEADKEIIVFEEITTLTKRVVALENQVGELKLTLKNYTNLINKVNEIVIKQNEIVETISAMQEIIGE